MQQWASSTCLLMRADLLGVLLTRTYAWVWWAQRHRLDRGHVMFGFDLRRPVLSVLYAASFHDNLKGLTNEPSTMTFNNGYV